MFSGIKGRCSQDAGQATVEAAFALPLLLGLVLLLVQPSIVLYDRMVMAGAAAEGCRMLATLSEGDPDDICQDAIRRHLGAIPQQEQFHVHEGECAYDILLSGGKNSTETQVTIRNKIKPLPLLDFACQALGIGSEEGLLTIEVSVAMPTQPGWVYAE